MSDLIVRKSDIGGSGVFAAKEFEEGEVVVPWVAEKILQEHELESLTPAEQECVSKMDSGTYILFAEPARCVNHSCNPNTVAKDNANIATRRIQEGEEITTDYELEGALNAFTCNCGSENCRGVIGKQPGNNVE